MIEIMRCGLGDAALVESRDLAPDVFVFGKLLDGGDPLLWCGFAVEVIADDVIHHDVELGDLARQLIDLLHGFGPLSIDEEIDAEIELGQFAEAGDEFLVAVVDGLFLFPVPGADADKARVFLELLYLRSEVRSVGIDVSDEANEIVVAFDKIKDPAVVIRSVTGFDDDHTGESGGFGDLVEFRREVRFVENLIVLGRPGNAFFARGVVEVDVRIDHVLNLRKRAFVSKRERSEKE